MPLFKHVAYLKLCFLNYSAASKGKQNRKKTPCERLQLEIRFLIKSCVIKIFPSKGTPGNSEQNTKHEISHRKLNQLFKIPLLLPRQHSQHKTSPQHHCWGLPRHKHRAVLWGTDTEVCWRTVRAQSVTEELKNSGLEFSL